MEKGSSGKSGAEDFAGETGDGARRGGRRDVGGQGG